MILILRRYETLIKKKEVKKDYKLNGYTNINLIVAIKAINDTKAINIQTLPL